MDIHNQPIKLCGICGNKRVYNDYHRLYNPWKICIAQTSVRYYQAIRNKKNGISKLCKEYTKYVQKLHTQQIKEPNKKWKKN